MSNAPVLVVKKIVEDAAYPMRETKGSAGLDLSSAEDGSIEPGKRRMIRTGISIKLPPGTFGSIRSRSGLARDYIDVAGGVGDNDYDGEIKVILHNSGTEHFHFKKRQRIAQLIIQPYVVPDVQSTEGTVIQSATADLPVRGEKGFGSTGMN